MNPWDIIGWLILAVIVIPIVVGISYEIGKYVRDSVRNIQTRNTTVSSTGTTPVADEHRPTNGPACSWTGDRCWTRSTTSC